MPLRVQVNLPTFSRLLLHLILSAKITRIDRAEGYDVNKGKKGEIVAKLNALVDPKIIEALYAASQAGVRVNSISEVSAAFVQGKGTE